MKNTTGFNDDFKEEVIISQNIRVQTKIVPVIKNTLQKDLSNIHELSPIEQESKLNFIFHKLVNKILNYDSHIAIIKCVLEVDTIKGDVMFFSEQAEYYRWLDSLQKFHKTSFYPNKNFEYNDWRTYINILNANQTIK